MGWLVAFIAIVVVVGMFVQGVLHPILYGLLIATMIVVPLWLVTAVVGGVIDSIFGNRR